MKFFEISRAKNSMSKAAFYFGDFLGSDGRAGGCGPGCVCLRLRAFACAFACVCLLLRAFAGVLPPKGGNGGSEASIYSTECSLFLKSDHSVE